MTDAELDAVRERERAPLVAGFDYARDAERDRRALLLEVDRLRAENEGLRRQVEGLAGCAYCGEPELRGDDAFCSSGCKEKDERLRAKWAREANR